MKRLIIFILSLVLAGVLVTGYTVMIGMIEQSVGRLSTATTGATTLTARDALARSMEAFLADTKSDRAALDGFVIGDEDVASVIDLLEAVAKKEKVQITVSSVSVVEQKSWHQHQGIQVALSVRGSFGAVADFFAVLENIPAASTVSRISLEASDKSWFGTVVITFVKTKS